MALLVGIGQPLLDIRANVTTRFITEQKLKPDDAIRVGPERLLELQKLTDADASYIPGGSCLNTIRVAQWMWKRRGSPDPSSTPRSASATASSRSLASASTSTTTAPASGVSSSSSSGGLQSSGSGIFASIKGDAPVIHSSEPVSDASPSSASTSTSESSSTSAAPAHHFLAHAAIVGAIGADELGGRLKRYVEDPSLAGCIACFQELPSPPHVTGTCLALVVPGGERSMVTMFGASELHSIEHLKHEAVAEQLANCEIVMLEAFYLLFNSDLVLKVAKTASEAGKRVVINISSTFVITTKTEVLREILSYCNVIIGNKGECEKLGLVFWPSEMSAVVTSAVGDESDPNNRDDVRVVGQRLLTDPKPKHTHHPRIVLITQGFLPTLVWHSVGDKGLATLHEFPVLRRVPEEDVVDTIGAGDSFMAGFLSQLAFDAPLAECIDAGHYAAAMVVRHAGCTFDDYPDFVYQPFIPLPAADGVSSTAPQSPSFYARSFSPFASPSGTPVLSAAAGPAGFAAGGVGRSPLLLGHSRMPSHHLAPLTLPPSSLLHVGSSSTTPAVSSSLSTSSSTPAPAPVTASPASLPPVSPNPASALSFAGMSSLSRLSVAEAAEAARLRKIARKHQQLTWDESHADRLNHYRRIAAIRARILNKEEKCSDEDRKQALLTAAQEDEWNQLAAQHGRWLRYGALQQKAAALAAEHVAHADLALGLHGTGAGAPAGAATVAPHTPPHTERKLGLTRVQTPTLSTAGASPAEVHEYYRRANRLLRAFDVRAGALRQLTSEETRKVLSTEGLAYLAHSLAHSVSRAEFAERYARQGLPELPFFPAA